ncbi:MAG: RNA polymerase sigma factor [Kiritimatiellae bacterium]|nr:RNA polymerase sigma factor [Kiritimatiellia bacterium]
MEISDAALVEASLQGDRESFGELVRRYRDVVYHLAYRMAGNRADADDLAQDTFVRAYDRLALYRHEYAFRSWVCTICANLAKNRFRREARRRGAEEGHADFAADAAARSDAPGDPRSERLNAVLARLPERLRVPLVLRHAEGMSYDEIAQVLAIRLSAAKMRVARARARVLKMWNERGDS